MDKKKSNPIINTLVLVIVTLVSVCLLAVVNQVTKAPIETAEVNQKAEAYRVVYPDCDSFAEVEGVEDMLANSEALLNDKGFKGCTIVDVLAAKNASGDIEGYVVASTSNAGYGGEIQIAIGIKDGKLVGFAPIKHSETPGFGGNCVNPEFTEQFAGKSASVLSFTKNGASSDTEIDALSGATITTNAVTQAVNAAIIFYQENFAGGAQEIAGKDLTEFYKAAYPGATEFGDTDKALIEASASILEQYGIVGATVEEAKIVNGGEGYVISTTGTGFAKASPMQIVIGIKDNTITGFAVVDCMETPGYGAAITEEPFLSQFAGKSVGIKTQVVGGTGDDQIDAVSGATFTSNGIQNAINAAVIFYKTNFGDASSIDTSAMPSGQVDATAGATVM